MNPLLQVQKEYEKGAYNPGPYPKRHHAQPTEFFVNAITEWNSKKEITTKELRRDATRALRDTFGFSLKQAAIVERLAWDLNNTTLSEYFNQLDIFGKAISTIIKIQ